MAATKHFLITALLFLFSIQSLAAVLPEERTDLLYHRYDGGGVTVDGPSFLVRRNINEKFSFYGNIYQDVVTSASIDVITTTSASPYVEERNEYSAGLDYLNDRSILSLGYTQSVESDYEAETISFSASQEFFGDLSTITMGYSLGNDTVRSNIDDTFAEDANRKRFNLGFSQIITRNILVSTSFEAVFDEGFLRNPYRVIRYSDGFGGSLPASEQYPETRNSSAFAQRGIFYISPLDASLRLEYRDYSDSWDVESENFEIRYAQNLNNALTFELRLRQYSQDEADFYQDLFDAEPIEGQFVARDKELSKYSSNQIGWTLSYTFRSSNRFLNNSSLNLSWDRLEFDYDNFRNAQAEGEIGEEPLYSLQADVVRLFFSSYF